MNYRHAYHAGNHADVLKHAVLAAAIGLLREKPTPLFILDTHAGAGVYDLRAPEAGKTGEWRGGVGRLLGAPAPRQLQAYCDIVKSVNPDEDIACYPGSPAIAAALLRPGDRLVLCELHPEDCETLRGWARGSRGVAVHRRDGYEAIGAFLPPREGRGLIVVDPPYEASDEYARLADAVIAGVRRWPSGRWLIWHPVKDRAPVWSLEGALLDAGVHNILSAELLVAPVDGVSLAGSGLLLINPPFGLEAWLQDVLPHLKTALAPQHGSYASRWLDRA
jgi:23S rRNA (adenine2030-N6)-methyltransferase